MLGSFGRKVIIVILSSSGYNIKGVTLDRATPYFIYDEFAIVAYRLLL